MHSAAEAGTVNMLRWMKSNLFDDYETLDDARQIPLYNAAAAGHVGAVAWFYTEGGMPKQFGWGKRGRKSIHVAASHGHL